MISVVTKSEVVEKYKTSSASTLYKATISSDAGLYFEKAKRFLKKHGCKGCNECAKGYKWYYNDEYL